jgi:hypothetical protein
MPKLRFLVSSALLAAICINVAAFNQGHADERQAAIEAARHEFVVMPSGDNAKRGS